MYQSQLNMNFQLYEEKIVLTSKPLRGGRIYATCDNVNLMIKNEARCFSVNEQLFRQVYTPTVKKSL